MLISDYDLDLQKRPAQGKGEPVHRMLFSSNAQTKRQTHTHTHIKTTALHRPLKWSTTNISWRLTGLDTRLSWSVGRNFDGVSVDGDLRRMTGNTDDKVKSFACIQPSRNHS